VKFRWFAVAAILAIALGAPILEMFDQWDQTLRDGNDAEANLVIAALCIGAAMVIGTVVVVARIRALASNASLRGEASRVIVPTATPRATPIPAISPPTPLRV
jgi:drug/metabolite transporter (DMT)-like permease